ncbi:MAG: DUF1194 domain-containing protein [Pseudomonadota bacterium]
MKAWHTLRLAMGIALLSSRAFGCDLALVLAVDVSGSVDNSEFRIQMKGLANGLRDDLVATALQDAQAAVLVVQWTGSSRQSIAVPWRRISEHADVVALAEDIERAPRRWRNFSTAIGEALNFSNSQFADVTDCARRVIDVSGDGRSNEGPDPRDIRGVLNASDVTVNAIVVEGAEPELTEYFRSHVIFGPGSFVITATSYQDYPERMRLKLLREVTVPIVLR